MLVMLFRPWMLIAIAAASAAGAEVSDLTWMAGCWATPASSSGSVIEEHWSKPVGGTMMGYSRTLKSTRVVFSEFIRIDAKENAILYTPRFGQLSTPVTFRLTRQTPNEVVFENPEHDFPQTISYRRAGDQLYAAVEGKDKGRQRREEFPYARVSCEK